VGLYHVYKGYKKKFLQTCGSTGRWVVPASSATSPEASPSAWSVCCSSWRPCTPSRAGDRADGAAHPSRCTVRQLLLTIVALGFASFAVYLFARSKYACV
jgi:hypothetical protein